MVGSEERQVAELRVFFDEYRQDGKGGLEQAGGFWLDVNVWGERLAADVAQLVKKGARVHVIGRLAETRWTVTATGEERSALHLNADHLFLSLTRMAEVRFKPRREASEGKA
jgi:single-strand DNA-binding protein